jgi:glycosyltransferase involved in cell wall biosynthesis
MKILMIAPEPFLEPRGTPISVYQRLRALSGLGYEVDLLTYPLGEEVVIPGVTIHRTPRLPFVREVKVGPSWAKLFLDLLIIGAAIRLLMTTRYDVIHAHEEAAFFSAALARLFGVGHLYDMHSSLPRQLENFAFGNSRPIIRLFEALERWTLRTCDAVITISRDLAEHIKRINPAVHLAVMENLPIQTFGASPDQREVAELRERLRLDGKLPIVYTGTFERYQGLDLLIESAEIVIHHHPQAFFLLVGGKPHQIEYWKNEARKRHLENHTFFASTVRVEEVLCYMEVADVLVSPRTDGTAVPLKIYSYLLSGKPVVATGVPSHTEIMTDDTAILVSTTAEAIADGLIKLIRDADLRRRLGLQAQQLIKQKYTLADYMEKLARAYEPFCPKRHER